MAFDEAGTRFLDGMRVATEHMRHLQQTAVDRARQLREALGSGGVAHGFKAEPGEGGAVNVSPGLAIDGHGRPVVLDAPATVAVPEGRHWLVAVYALRSKLLVGGVPTLLSNAATLEARPVPPPYGDGAVVFAECTRTGERFDLLQRGEWYLPPLHHGHSGGFFTDAAGRWRYDGAPVGGGLGPHFDSGFVTLAPGERVTRKHGLQTQQLLVDLVLQRGDGAIGNRGVGSEGWYELPDAEHVTLARAAADSASPLALRVRAWRTEGAGPALADPIADAGPDFDAAPGASFLLDASRSRALGGRQLVRYAWTLMS